ncbi:DegT/DnrJ/EryC1/StrS family aminotransferase [Rhizobium sp. YJ-22]|uniref:DegT/DnrJ/EryC1/StrS family aminotransferase n=1 Tax=Rhizobium sp. YJ-22 TaxID=3037556 RepID=UPI002412D1D2|nr:DegT/DnrJ/EryC1/StrS family aminotransferase [Rhizobium sp. YJ-22]MDG3575275.1 DegT/DnrJ/EryC1/StrS family aminotransferase [Rhizobium sp. YJ-22]
MTTRILYTKPSITELETGYATDAAANGWGEKCYDYIVRFEAMFREHLGSRFAIATSSCTGALHMGLAALGIGPGDEVILADTNWVATVSPIVHLGATPVPVDIDPESWCIDPAAAARAITPRTRAIVVTHIYGNLANMDALLALGEQTGIPVVEDSAEAIGSIWHGRRAGSMGIFGAFSFHGTKTLTTGEGGMFVTSDEELFERVLTLSNHGRARNQKKQFWPDLVGFKYKMSNIQAAIGCAQMERIEELTARKREIFAQYRHELAGLPGISMNPEAEGTVNGAWMPTVVFDADTGVTREQMQEAFAAANIDARVFFHPLSSLPMFTPQRENVHAWSIPGRAINLPSYHDMSEDDTRRVCAVIRDLAARAERNVFSPTDIRARG